MSETLYIKNMVCPRCIESVANIFADLKIETGSIQLGEVVTNSPIENSKKVKLEEQLITKGFELLKDKNATLIGQIKSLVIAQIHHSDEPLTVSFSSYISEKLKHEYSSLSKLFSSVEGITIERFILKQKIERVKEYIFYNELTLSEISFQMGYSSVAHLSTQFKKETGMSPTEFKKLRNPGHKSLDAF